MMSSLSAPELGERLCMNSEKCLPAGVSSVVTAASVLIPSAAPPVAAATTLRFQLAPTPVHMGWKARARASRSMQMAPRGPFIMKTSSTRWACKLETSLAQVD